MNKIYLDNNATTKVDKQVVDEMNKFYLEEYGNPSSMHEMGEKAREAIDKARAEIAQELGCKSWEIIFTSGTTESNNLSFFGLARSKLGERKKKIIVSAIEHSSIFELCDALKKEGFDIVEIGVDNNGLINFEELKNKIDDKTLLVSIMHVNNEIGIIQDIEKIGKICGEKKVLFHSDCAQSFGKLNINVKDMNIDLLSAGAHKISGPKGIGILYLREGIEIAPLIYGSQEKGLRGGTENVPGIVGIAKALQIAKKIDKEKIEKIRDYLINELEKIGKINGSKEQRIYDNVNVSFPGIDGEELVLLLSSKGIFVSIGSACDSKKKKESKVLREIGLNKDEIMSSIRIGIGKDIEKKDADMLLKEIKKLISFKRRFIKNLQAK